MRKSYLAATVLTFAMTAFSPSAFAGCGVGTKCDSWVLAGSGHSSSTGYSSAYGHSYGGVANCPAGTRPSSDGTCLVTGSGYTYASSRSGYSSHSGSSYSSSSSSRPVNTYSYSSTPLGSYSSHSMYSSYGGIATMSDSEADYKYGSGSISATYTDGANTIVPFSTTTASMSNYRVPGMGANEFLSPTRCPVSVYNPEGGKVLGCYSVSKPAPPRIVRPVYHAVRVVRPVIYVHYPVTVAHPTCRVDNWSSRYGETRPRRHCGW